MQRMILLLITFLIVNFVQGVANPDDTDRGCNPILDGDCYLLYNGESRTTESCPVFFFHQIMGPNDFEDCTIILFNNDEVTRNYIVSYDDGIFPISVLPKGNTSISVSRNTIAKTDVIISFHANHRLCKQILVPKYVGSVERVVWDFQFFVAMFMMLALISVVAFINSPKKGEIKAS